MAGKVALDVALFIILCIPSGTISSQVVPDGLVYTEVEKTLVQGVKGILTCRFYGNPNAVYWEIGHVPEDLTTMILWHEGDVSGPRYDDGSYDIDDTFSLIINNVSTTDAGRIYCTVSNHRGILIRNYTDISVTDTAVATKQQVILEMDDGAANGILRCTTHIKARRVSWKKGKKANESLVVLENNQNVAERSGAGYEGGMFNITDDYSLIIRKVQVHHEGLYICEATDFDTGISFRNNTFVIVVAQPLKPFPTIQECLNTEKHGSNYCTLDVESEMSLTCQAMRYYPSVNLLFLHGSGIVKPSVTREWNNTDGTKNKTVTISATGSRETYTCVAFNIPGTSGNRSTSVLLLEEEPNILTLVIILVLFAAVTLISLVTFFIWRKRRRHGNGKYTPVQIELPGKEVKDLTEEEFQALEKSVDNILIKHCRRIHKVIETKSTKQLEKIIKENRTAIFDTHQMLTDWRQSPKSANCQTIEIIKDISDIQDEPGHAWPSDEELMWISRHLTQDSIQIICKKLNVSYKSRDTNDKEEMLNSLRGWRNKTRKSVEKRHKELYAALKSNSLVGLLPPFKGQFVYKAELVDMAFQLLVQDLLPVAKALSISVTKLVSYKRVFQPPYLEMGTIALLSKLLENTTPSMLKFLEKGDTRFYFCKEIRELQYEQVATHGLLVYDMSYGELCSISEAMTPKAEGGSACQVIPTSKSGGASPCDAELAKSELNVGEKGSSLCAPSIGLAEDEREEDTDTENAERGQLLEPKDQIPEIEPSKEPGKLHHVLQLTDQDLLDMPDSLESSDSTKAFALFKIWKEKPRSSVFNYRAALSDGLRKIQMTDLADKVIAGNYISKHTSPNFIQNMVQGLTQDQLRNLGKLLNLSGKDEHWHTNTPLDAISQQICDWIGKWTKEMKNRNKTITKVKADIAEMTSVKTTAGKHRNLNDKLVEHGFLDLAREIMILEQQLAYA